MTAEMIRPSTLGKSGQARDPRLIWVCYPHGLLRGRVDLNNHGGRLLHPHVDGADDVDRADVAPSPAEPEDTTKAGPVL